MVASYGQRHYPHIPVLTLSPPKAALPLKRWADRTAQGDEEAVIVLSCEPLLLKESERKPTPDIPNEDVFSLPLVLHLFGETKEHLEQQIQQQDPRFLRRWTAFEQQVWLARDQVFHLLSDFARNQPEHQTIRWFREQVIYLLRQRTSEETRTALSNVTIAEWKKNHLLRPPTKGLLEIDAVAAILIACLVDPLARRQLLRQLMTRWSEVLRTGQPVIRAEKNPALFGPLGEALFPVNYVPAQQLAASLDLPAGAQILDVGAGSCAWSIPFVKKNAQVQVDALDLAPVLLTTSRSFTQRYGVEHRYRFISGDISRPEEVSELHDVYDLILLGHVCCILSQEENQTLFQHCAARLKPGGQLVVIDFLPWSDRSGPLLDVLFEIMMVGTNDAGNAWPREFYETCCRQAGLTSCEWRDVSAASTPFLIARKASNDLLVTPASRQRQASKDPAGDEGFVPPTPIIEGSFAFAQSCMLLASVELDLYTHIDAGAQTPAQLAAVVLLEVLQERLQQGRAYHELLKRAIQTPLLLIDDLDKPKPSEFREAIYYLLIDKRTLAGRPLALSSNVAPPALERWVGKAARSRLLMDLSPVDMRGQDYRLRTGKSWKPKGPGLIK